MAVGSLLVALGTASPAAAAMGGPAPVDVAGVALWASSLQVSGLDAADTAAVQSLWGEFLGGLPHQASCLLASPPQVVAKSDMRPRAAYAPSISTLYVKPGDLDRLVVFHELAHHLDFTCGAAEEVGADFREAQGISASKPWWQHGRPVTWPAEYFANAVAVSLGETSRHGVTSEAVIVVSRWTGRLAPEPVVRQVEIGPVNLIGFT